MRGRQPPQKKRKGEEKRQTQQPQQSHSNHSNHSNQGVIFSQNQCVYIRNEPSTQRLLQYLRDQCTLKIQVYERKKNNTVQTESHYREYIDEHNRLFYVFPRHVFHVCFESVPLSSFGSEDTLRVIDFHEKEIQPRTEFLAFCGSLDNSRRRRQADASRAIVEGLRRVGGAILTMPPGTGKTVTACHIASTIGLPTCVITHTSELYSQWEERIRQFLPKARIGAFTSHNKLTTQDHDILLVMMKTCAMLEEQLRGIGLVVIDEAHHICAETLRLCLDKFNAPYVLGLTATPERKDKRTPLLFRLLGPMTFHLQVPYDLPVCLVTIRHENPRLSACDFDRCNRVLERDTVRMETVLSLAFEHIPDIGQRRVLVLASRVLVADNAYTYIRMRLADKYKIPRELVCRLSASTTPSENIVAKLNARVLVCTDKLVSEGFDVPNLDTLIRIMPSGEGVQTYGRVMRTHPNKRLPVYIVEVDDICNSMLRGMYRKRTRVLKEGPSPNCAFTDGEFTTKFLDAQ